MPGFLASPTGRISKATPADVTIDGRFLYGAPAANLDLEGEVKIKPAADRPGFAGYTFGTAPDDEDAKAVQQTLEDLGQTDEQGQHVGDRGMSAEELRSTFAALGRQLGEPAEHEQQAGDLRRAQCRPGQRRRLGEDDYDEDRQRRGLRDELARLDDDAPRARVEGDPGDEARRGGGLDREGAPVEEDPIEVEGANPDVDTPEDLAGLDDRAGLS